MKKRILAIVMVLIMVASLLPTGVFAESSIYGDNDDNKHDHLWNWTVIKEATCTEAGEEHGKCSVCGATQKREIPALGHDWNEEIITAAGCLTDGVMERECSRCGEKETEVIPAPGHSWGRWCAVGYPDGDGSYSMVRKCFACGVEEEKECGAELRLEIVSTEDSAGKRAGDYVNVTFRVTNSFSETASVYGVRHNSGSGSYASDRIEMNPAELAPKESMEFVLRICLTQADIDRGYASREVSVNGHYGEGATDVSSNTVNTVVSFGGKHDPFEGGMGGGADELPFLQVVETVLNGPNCYSGETIVFKVTVTNATDWYVGEVEIHDALTGNISKVTLADHSSVDVYFPYGVNDQDLINSPIKDHATAKNPVIGEVDSNTVSITVDPKYKAGHLDVAKTVSGGPSNGMWYQMYEPVKYEITVTNNTGVDMKNLTLYDVLSSKPLIFVSELKNGESFTEEFKYELQPGDISGTFSNVAYACATGSDGRPYNGMGQVMIETEHGYDWGLLVCKTEVSDPDNGEFYTEGEDVKFEITVTNYGESSATYIEVYDPLVGNVGIFQELKPYEGATAEFTYTVTANDVKEGHISSAASAHAYSYIDNNTFHHSGSSETVSVYTGKGNEKLATISQSCSGPFSAKGFQVEGDVLNYDVSFCNNTGEEITDIVIYSPSADKNPILTMASMAAGQWGTAAYSHEVSYGECCGGKAETTVYMNYRNAAGEYRTVVSNMTAVDADILKYQFSVVLSVTSQPKDITNATYTLNETVTYDIVVTNNSKVDLLNCSIRDDVHAKKYNGLIATDPVIQAGGSATYHSAYKIEAADIGPYLTNIAFLEGTTSDGTPVSLKSFAVCVKCNGNPVIVHQGPLSGDGDEGCVVSLNADNDGDLGYTVESCGGHAEIDSRILDMVSAAADADGRRDAWIRGQELWTDEIAEIYDRLLEKAEDPGYTSVIMNDQSLLMTQINGLADALNEVYPNDAEKAARLVAEELKYQCAELCGLLHHGGEDMTGRLVDELGGLIGNGCAVTELERTPGYSEYLIDLCGMHRATGELTAIALGATGTQTGVSTAPDWTALRSMWEAEYDAVMDARYKDASGTLRDRIRTEHISFLNWEINHELFLNIFYENAIVRDSFIVRSILRRTALTCEVSEGLVSRNAGSGSGNGTGSVPVWNTSAVSHGKGGAGNDGGKDKGGFPGWAFAVIGVAAVGGAGGVVASKKKKAGKGEGKEQ